MLYKTLHTFARLNGYLHIDTDSIRIAIETSPYAQTMLGIMRGLEHLGMNVNCSRLKKEELFNIQGYFLIHLVKGNNAKFLICKILEQSIEIYNERGNKIGASQFETFIPFWDNIVVYVQDIPKRKIGIIKGNFRQSIVSTLAIVIFASTFFVNAKILIIMGGLFLSILAINILPNKGIYEKLCANSIHFNCNVVSSSKYSTIFGLKIVDMSLSFFLSQLITLMILCFWGINIDEACLALFYYSTFIIIPIAGYSIFAQLSMRRFCPLCISIIAILFIEGIIAMQHYHHALKEIIPIQFGCFIFMLAAISLYRYCNNKRKEVLNLRIKLLSTIRKPEVFRITCNYINNATLPDNGKITHSGSAKNILKIFVTPGCKYCKHTKSIITHIVKRYEKAFTIETFTIDKSSSEAMQQQLKQMDIKEFPTIILNNWRLPLSIINLSDIHYLTIDEELFNALE